MTKQNHYIDIITIDIYIYFIIMVTDSPYQLTAV